MLLLRRLCCPVRGTAVPSGRHMAARAAFLGYAVFAVSVIVFLILYVAPQHGTSNLFVYLGVCSLAGSLSVMSCKVRGMRVREGRHAWGAEGVSEDQGRWAVWGAPGAGAGP